VNRSIVAIVKTASKPTAQEVETAVREAVLLAGGLGECAGWGKRVLIKPNLVALARTRYSGATTNVDVVKAVADLVRESGARSVIAESSAVGVDTEKVIEFEKYSELRAQGYEVVDLKREPKVHLRIPGGKVLKEISTFKLVLGVDAVISVPVMKTHDQAEITVALKNLKGLAHDLSKRKMHQTGVLEGVPDLASALPPCFAVVDGTYCQEGMGPIFGSPVEMDLILASPDLVAADAVAGKIMGYEPSEVPITVNAAARGLGVADLALIDVLGCPIADVARRFKRASEDTICVPGLRIVFRPGTCTGCHNTVFSAIAEIEADGQLARLKGKAIVAGTMDETDIPTGVKPEDLILVGLCTRKFKDRGKYVEGCPPSNIWIAETAVGGPVKSRIFV